MRRHLILSALAGFLAALFVWWYYRANPWAWSDVDQLRLGAQALLVMLDPYSEVPKRFPWPLYYPLPAVMIALPLAPLPLWLARSAFAFLTTAVAVYSALRYRPLALIPLCSGAFCYALYRGQWSPLIFAACLIPAWQWLVAVKPTVALAAIAYRPSWTPVFAACSLLVISVLILPRWPLHWLQALQGQHHLRSPLLLPAGFLLALALLRWRRPEARLFVVLTAVPQTVVPYELVPLAVIPRTLREALIVSLGFTLAYIFRVALNPVKLQSFAGVSSHYFPYNWWAELAFGYLPSLVLI